MTSAAGANLRPFFPARARWSCLRVTVKDIQRSVTQPPERYRSCVRASRLDRSVRVLGHGSRAQSLGTDPQGMRGRAPCRGR
jgi:hypothetical protein